MAQSILTEQFVKQLGEVQSRLYAFALSLLGDPEAANDVVQETNVVLWQKIDELPEVRSFTGWAMKVCYYQVLTVRKKQVRERLLFNDDLIEQMAVDAEVMQGDIEQRLSALHECLSKLSDHQQTLINRRYRHCEPVAQIASGLGRSANHVSVMLFRIRTILMQCVENALA